MQNTTYSYDKTKVQNLRIRAYLQTGVISDQYLPLDSIIYYHAVREKFGDKVWSKPGESNIREYGNINLPFSKSNIHEDAWFYCCSFAQWSANTIEDSSFYVKRFDVDQSDMCDFGGKVAKVDISRGQFKNYHIKVYYRHAQFVEWYARGMKEEIERLLNFCTHIGKKTDQGWGSVLKWEVMDWAEDWSIRGFGNKLMRNVPMHAKGLIYGLRPPYWNSRHQFNCKMPD